MATYYRNRDLLIAVDPGYDATKVVINGVMISVPNNVIDITGQTKDFLALGDSKARGYLCSHYIDEKDYLVGTLARKSIMEKNVRNAELTKYTMMDSYERFQTRDFEVNMMTVIGYAIVEYAKEVYRKNWKPEIPIMEKTVTTNEGTKKVYTIPSLKDWRIIVGVALPNDVADISSKNCVWPFIEPFLVKKHNFSIDVNMDTFELDFEIIPGHAMPASQVICALLGAAGDDSGIIDRNSPILKKLPVIVIDGGYKTVGLFMLTQAQKVSEAESNTEFAMGNVHKEVANLLKEDYGREIEPYQIPFIVNEEGGRINCLVTDNNGNTNVETVDVKRMAEAAEESLCNKLINYLNAKFDNLLDIKQILITGGTGSAYYSHINKYMKEKRGHLQDSVILTNYKFRGEPIDPVYAIALGMYKTLNDQLQKALERDKAANKGAKSATSGEEA